MLDARDVVRASLSLLYNAKEYTYCLGTQGDLLKNYKDKIDYYYATDKGAKALLNELAKGNTKAFDCSGLVNYVTKAPARLVSANYGGMCATTPKDGKAGYVLWKHGHVGIDIGLGFFIHIPSLGHTVELGRIAEYNWEKSVPVEWVDYSHVDNY